MAKFKTLFAVEGYSRESFPFYKSFRDAIREVPPEVRVRIYDALISYGLDGVKPDFASVEGVDGVILRALWPGIQAALYANWQRYLNGLKGGAPEGNQNALKQPRNNQETTEKQAIEKCNLKSETCNVELETGNLMLEKENENDESAKAPKHRKSKKASSFSAPSLEDIELYCREHNLNTDAKKYFLARDAVGWKVKGSPLVKWPADLELWAMNERPRPASAADRVTIPEATEDEFKDTI